jgi:hypothetical protein
MLFKRAFGGFAFGLLGAVVLLLSASPSRADTAVSSCQTLSAAGNYFLTKNLTSSGTCITVASEGVSLDMKGHSITGNGSGDGITDGGVQFESMAIANGKISHFANGIGLGKSCCVVIRNVNSSNNTGTGILVGTCCGTLDAVTANNNGADGIDAFDCCYTLNNVQSSGNAGGGVITANCCTTISNSTVTGNGGIGVSGTGCCNFLISSTVQKNGGDGADMSGCCNFVVNSMVTLNMGIGISLTGDDNLVTGTNSSSNSGDGIFLATDENQITNSQAKGNGGFGANVGCPGAITGLHAKSNSSGSLNTTGGTCTQLNNTL